MATLAFQNYMVCGIYMIKNTINGKVYIGQSKHIIKRWRVELRVPPNPHLLRAFNKDGRQNFTFEVLEECEISELNSKEIEYIKEYNSTDAAKGYNKSSGGNQGTVFSEDTRKRMSDAKKNGNFVPWNTGRACPEETKKKISESHIGKPAWNKGMPMFPKSYAAFSKYNEEKAKAVINLDTGEIYKSVADAARSHGLLRSNVSKVCGGKVKRAGGYRFAFVNKETT